MAGMFVMGFVGTVMLTTLQSSIADYHGENGTIGLTESNVIAVIFAAVGPQIVAFGELTPGLGWRFAWWVMVLFGVGVFIVFRQLPFPTPSPTDGTHAHCSTVTGSILALLGGGGVFHRAGKWSLIYWGADFLRECCQIPRHPSQFVGVALLSGDDYRADRGQSLGTTLRGGVFLWVAIFTFAVGFGVFWLMPYPLARVTGLFIAGTRLCQLVSPHLVNRHQSEWKPSGQSQFARGLWHWLFHCGFPPATRWACRPSGNLERLWDCPCSARQHCDRLWLGAVCRTNRHQSGADNRIMKTIGILGGMSWESSAEYVSHHQPSCA
jgi:hypothetical protein